jgi:hypothetical protein
MRSLCGLCVVLTPCCVPCRYVGNLNIRVTETQLVEVFSAIGPVKSCKIKNPTVRREENLAELAIVTLTYTGSPEPRQLTASWSISIRIIPRWRL